MSRLQTHSSARVLVVEDDFLVRLTLVDVLEDAGFRVYEADGADRALRTLEEKGDIAAVFTDIDMPGSIDGLELARRVGRRWPEMRVIVTSGGAQAPKLDLPDGGIFIPKPYSAARIVAKLRAMLEEPATAH
jgi:DNA-binding NtrC family response regulator